jgi:hypothetical protein
MLGGAFIITQSQFLQSLQPEALGKFVNESLNIFGHRKERLAQMENDTNTISKASFVESVAYLLREAFEGSPEGQPSAFLRSRSGMFNTLDGLSAEDASREVAGMTVAAQTEHAKFYLDRL